jgi:hypothetical protein
VTAPITASPQRLADTQAKNSAKRILGFDSWAGGSWHFERLLPAFRERGMTFTLVHIGSWGSDTGRPDQEKIGSMNVRDVSFYQGKSFDQILDIERPDAVLLLSTQTFAHRAFLRYCERRSIPSLHLYHGLANVQITDDDKGSHGVARVAYAAFVAARLGKLIKRTFPCYIGALLKTGATLRDWTRFFHDVARLARGLPFPVAAADARTSKVAVYTQADIEHAVRVYGLKAERVVAVGNPDLMRFDVTEKMLGAKNQRNASHLATVMYIDTALALVGLLFKSYGSFIEHLGRTAQALAAHTKKLAFKPHPAHNLAALERDLRGTGVEIVANNDFVARLRNCCACITETTSLALVPALLGMPLLLAAYGELKTQRFGLALTSYPRAYLLEDIADFTAVLQQDAEEFDSKSVSDWIAANSGPLPAGEMPMRIARIMESLIRERQAVAL